MTGHATTASAVTTIGCYVVFLGGIVALGIRCRLQDRRRHREALALHQARVAQHERAQRPVVRTIVLPSGQPLQVTDYTAEGRGRRRTSLATCEAIWKETLAWGQPPDRDLLDEWEGTR